MLRVACKKRVPGALRNSNKPFIAGIIVVVILYLPLLILNDDALYIMHDQLDGEVLVYILNAKNWSKDIISNLFDGVSKTALTPASVGSLIFYFILPPMPAFLANYMFVAVISYLSLFLCLKRLKINEWWIMGIAIIYAILPFYSVYGLSVMGQPLLIYSFILLYEKRSPLKAYTIIILFGLFSSLVLVGYADLLFLVCITSYLWVKKVDCRYRFAIGTTLLTIVYLMTNYQLLLQILFPNSTLEVSHKTEIVAKSASFLQSFIDMFAKGYYHAASRHSFILLISAFVIAIILYKKYFDLAGWFYKLFVVLFGMSILIAAFYAFWNCAPVVDIRNKLGGVFVYFQVDRFYWLYPCLWFILLGLVLFFVEHTRIRERWKKIICTFILVGTFLNVYSGGTIKANVDKLIFENDRVDGYETWTRFYSEDLFEKIKEYIGKPCTEYRVGSIGLYPSIALYNGMNCIDGYSNNYDINYKHKFRKIIENELNKNESLRIYFDEWGNRCYLFAAEIPYMYTIQKNSDIVLRDVDFDVDALKMLNCDYLLSAAPIESSHMSERIKYCRKFENEESPYAIYLYQIL